MTISSQERPPLRFLVGADAVETAQKVVSTLQQQTDAYREHLLSHTHNFKQNGRSIQKPWGDVYKG
jgi:hypothetical protein